MLLLIGVWIFFMRQMQGGGSGGRGAMSFGRSKARLISEETAKVTFEDVAGVDEAKEELSGGRGFPARTAQVHPAGRTHPQGRAPGGASPGTGKTLLARAVAGEAGVPFYNHFRFRLRGDVRGRGRFPRARPLCPGQEKRALPDLHRRDRRPWAASVARAWAAVTTSASRP